MRRVAFLLAYLVPSALFAQGWMFPRPCGPIADPVPGRPLPRPMPNCGVIAASNVVRTRSDVRVEMVDKVLKYEVDERFVNTGNVVGEADYLFPMPAGAAFQDLQLSINGEMMSGETMNATQARQLYEEIVRRQRDPALVEWMGYGLLRARVFPLNPGEEKRVVVRFQTVAQREGDALRIDYFRGDVPQLYHVEPGQTLPRGAYTVAASFTLRYKPSPELGAPYSPTHELDVNDRDGMREVAVKGDAKDVTLLVPVRRANAAGIAMIPYAPGGEDGFALITVSPPSRTAARTTPRDVTLVIDVSGSMQGRKIEQARAAGRQVLATLRPEDRFRIIDFSSDVRTFCDTLVRATNEHLSDASQYLDQLEANGGTNIEGALREALRSPTSAGRLPIVLFITDGEPTIGEQRPAALVDIAKDGARQVDEGARRRIFTFGLGADVNASLLEQLAIEGGGTSQFVRPDESVEREVGIVASRIVDPVMTNVRVRAEGGVQLSKALPSSVSDIFAGRDLVLLARYSGHGAGRIVVDGKQGGDNVQWSTPVEFPDRDRANAFVARLWATQRVGWLSAERRRVGPSSELDDEIKMLGERYGIPTELTSYLVQEPRVMTTGMMNGVGGAMPAVAPAPQVQQFEEARKASQARAAMSLSAVDAMGAPALTHVTMTGAVVANNGPMARQTVGNRIFTLRDGVWTDERYHTGTTVTSVKPYSAAYFALLDKIPELRAVFALGDRVVVVGRATSIEVSEKGVESLELAVVERLSRQF